MSCCLVTNDLILKKRGKVIGAFNLISTDKKLNDSDTILFDNLQSVLLKQHYVSYLDTYCCCYKMKKLRHEAMHLQSKKSVRFSSDATGRIWAFEFDLDENEDENEQMEEQKEKEILGTIKWEPESCCKWSCNCYGCLCLPCPAYLAPNINVLSEHEIKDLEKLIHVADSQEKTCFSIANCLVATPIPCVGCILAAPFYCYAYTKNEGVVKDFQVAASESIRMTQPIILSGSIQTFYYYNKSYPSKAYKTTKENESMIIAR
jgi:hypothetical protein